MAADPVLHVIDSYYFEVPKFMWQYSSADQVPAWLRNQNPDATLEQYKAELDGKIIIPQPFGEIKDLYTRESGFTISRHTIIELVVAVLLIFLFTTLASRMRVNAAPKGRLWNLLESFLVYLRDNVIRPAIDGGHHDHDDAHAQDTHGHNAHSHDDHHWHGKKHHGRDSDKFLPILWTTFFFILFCNLFGILPWMGSPTGSFPVTIGLAACTLIAGLIFGSKNLGILGYWSNLMPKIWIDLPGGKAMKPVGLVFSIGLMIMIFLIEVLGLIIKHLILSVRLLANMVAGHLVIGGIMGLIVAAAASSNFSYWITTVIAVIGTTLFFMLELFVAFLQAYIFTFLSSLFIGAAIHKH
jgi:F-type H+-transporting ATPase subunit a